MPQKRNPVLSVLIRRAALTAPLLGRSSTSPPRKPSTSDPTAPGTPSGDAAALLARHAVAAASQAAELVDGLAGARRHGWPPPSTAAAMPDLLAERAPSGP